MVSFTFDDFNRSALNVAGSILEAAGARGTYYAALGLMNSGEDLFTEEDVHRLVAAGHDLQCHTFAHLSSTQHPIQTYVADIVRAKAAIANIRLDHHCEHFAYPFGHVTPQAKKCLGRLFLSCRGIQSGVNGPVADLNLLRANRLYSASVPLESVKEQIEWATRAHGWLIFYTHDVREQPSTYGCTPEYFEEVIRYTTDAGAAVVTVSEGVRAVTEKAKR
jgi:peptidoglycan/xylan/chitin deacetylase (PgdA/CDA1 family)